MKKGIFITLGTALILIPVAYLAGGPLDSDTRESDRAGRSDSHVFASEDAAGNASLDERVQQLEKSLRAAQEIQARTLDLVEELQEQLESTSSAPGQVSAAMREAATSHDNRRSRRRLSRAESEARLRDHQFEQLVLAGMTPERAEFVLRKQERFQYEHMQISHAYQHQNNKRSPEAQALREKLDTYSNPRKMFAEELSDSEFEAYLDVLNGRQDMEIRSVVSDTPAATAGLQSGDKIISYNGSRVFHMGDLRTEIYKVPPGKDVAIEVKRAGSGQVQTLYVPSGPLGIRS